MPGANANDTGRLAAKPYVHTMTHRMTPLERAFELARSGDCPDVSSVKACLLAEGYSTSQLVGPMLMRQLRTLCVESQGAR
jgi:hypothetical protein